MILYLVPLLDDRANEERGRLLGSRGVMVVAMDRHLVRHVVAIMTREDCTGLVLPDDYRRHTKDMEHVKACALHMGLQVLPLTAYLHRKKPVAGLAVPPTQQRSAAGQPHKQD